MENERTSQPLATSENGRRFQWLPLANSAQTDDVDEGGLNLGQVVATLRRRIFIIAGVTTVVTSLALLKALTSKPLYQSSFEILTKPVTVENQVISSVPQSLSKEQQQQQSAEAKGIDETKLKLLKSPIILSSIAKQLQLKYPDIDADSLAAGLVVTGTTTSEILSVSYQDGNPDKVKAILSLVSDAYLRYSLEERLADVRQGIDFVNAQLPQLQKRVEAIQDQLQGFRQQYNLIDPESKGKQLTEQTTTISQQWLDTQVKLNEARALYLNLSLALEQQTDDSAASTALSDNARYQKLLNQILEVESQRAAESSLYLDKSPNVQVLQTQEKNLLPLLQREGRRVQEEVASKIRDLEARSRILAQTSTGLNQQVKQLSAISRQYVDIQRELTIATENLNQFLTKREALRIDAGQRKTPWQLLTPPTEPIPSSANVKRTALLGAILGLLVGIGIALLLDKLSNVLHTSEDVKTTTKLPILGVIPFNPELAALETLIPLDKVSSLTDMAGLVHQMRQRLGFNSSKSPRYYSASPFQEAFRSLYANILLLNPDERIRSLVVSSATPGEGKSTTAIYLAQAAAALGQRVLLVDADLRLPQLHSRLDLENGAGLSTVIASDLDFERVVQKSLLDSNLSVLTSGQVPPDPTKLLSSKKMQGLIDQFNAAYDLVIYDMPPILGLADVKLLALRTDGIVMVVGLDKAKASVVTQALETLKPTSIQILGVVANGSKELIPTMYNSYHRYGSSEAMKRADEVTETAVKSAGD
ncbi:MAG: polysaccharide biosynthesis tyrosine autokinase [Stenomitos rutilans HA7619-LM2]|jgi:capsular exopolysaccharide synthesis family protein|nr:polysaccharide biosynthesis tyrosine autokinase [Stenomitos rutilans HA7619-LM2]